MKPLRVRLSPIILLAWLLPLCVIAIPLGFGGWYLAQKHQWAQTRLDGLEPRYARILGLQANVPVLDKAIEDAEAMLERHAYPSKQDESQAGNAPQQHSFGIAALRSSNSEVCSLQQGWKLLAVKFFPQKVISILTELRLTFVSRVGSRNFKQPLLL